MDSRAFDIRVERCGRGGRFRALLGLSLIAMAAFASAGISYAATSANDEKKVVVGLITKDTSNPYWVAIANGAKLAAERDGVQLISSAGKADTDNASQVAAIEDMITQGVSTILITPAANRGVAPAMQKARDAGIQVIALDSAPDPASAADAVFATNHTTMGKLIGDWAREKFKGQKVKIAMVDADPAAIPSVQRHNGFLEAFGIDDKSPQIAGIANGHATIAGGLAAMQVLLEKDPDINLVYTATEPTALGVYQALQKAGKQDSVAVITNDGGCQGMGYVKAGKFAADSQQYPGLMAEKGIEAAIAFVKTGTRASGVVDTGETLVTDSPMNGVPSITSAEGAQKCWGGN